jgi:hypothetical protein
MQTYALTALLERQHGLITRQQSLAFFTEPQVDSKLGRSWQVILPGVYATFTGAITKLHRRQAALLHGGEFAQLTDVDALDLSQVQFVPGDPQVHLLVPNEVRRNSRGFVVVRRTTRLPTFRMIAGFPVAPTARALCDFARRHDDQRGVLAVWAAAVQAKRTTIEAIAIEVEHGAARGRPRLQRLLDQLLAGIRSLPEADFRDLVLTSTVLPEPLWNRGLELPDGSVIYPDALWEDAGLIHETNGRKFHSGEDAFEDMQRRHDRATTFGLTALHNTPRRIRGEGGQVLHEVEQTYLPLRGRGLPPGVRLLPATN